MSRAFIKEDVDPPERSGRVRSTSGLPPGAANYITAAGAARLRAALAKARVENDLDPQRLAALESTLASVSIVEPPSDLESVAFGAKVTVRDKAGRRQNYRIVGVDEIDFYPDAVSWISPVGKALLAANLGDRVTLDGGGPVELVQVEYPID